MDLLITQTMWLFSVVSVLLDQLEIFWQLLLIELLELLIGLGLLELWHLIYPRLSKSFGMQFFFANSNLMEFQVGNLVLLYLNARKTWLILFDQSNNFDPIARNEMGRFLKKNHLIRCWNCLSLYCTVALTLSLLLKLPSRKLEPWFILWFVSFCWGCSLSL